MRHQTTGIEYWRSLEQLADAPEIREAVEKEFPGYDADTMASTSRRSFLKLMAASLAFAGMGLSGCRRAPVEKLAPYTAGQTDRVPGLPEQFATCWELGGVSTGLLVTAYDGRPIKVEGNPSHPFSWTVPNKVGAADAFAQASVLELYDPQRSRSVVDRTGGRPAVSSWDAFAAAFKPRFKKMKRNGTDLAVLAEPAAGPSMTDMRERFLLAFPHATWCEYDPLTRDAELEGGRLAFGGKAVRPVLHLDRASVVVLLDADLFGSHPAKVRYAADWAATRRSADRVDGSDRRMSRVYMAESGFSLTGAAADERLGLTPDRLDHVARALAARLGVSGVPGEAKLSSAEVRLVNAAAADLNKAKSAGVVAAGPSAPPAVHALAFAINHSLGAVGKTVTFHTDPAGERPTHLKAIADLAADIKSGKITNLLILGGNPAYDAPAELEFASLLAKVPTTIRLGLYDDETSAVSKWHLPRAHYLEAWGDGRALDGTATLAQPLIEPLFGGKSAIEVLAMLCGDEMTGGEEIVRRSLQGLIPTEGFDKRFRQALEAGVLPGSAYPVVNSEPNVAHLPAAMAAPVAPAGTKGKALVVRFEPDARVYDGRFANNAWLQETPEPLTKLVWDNAALLSKSDADGLRVTTGDLLWLDAGGGRWLVAAAYILPGQPAGVVGLSLGYGRTNAGAVGNGLGFNAYALRTAAAPYAAAVAVRPAGETYELASTQNHHIMDTLGASARDERVGPKGKSGGIIREARFAEYQADPGFARSEGGEGGRTVSLQLFDPPSQFNTPHAWGMAVDLNACIGCNACAVACQSENNIPVVGKEQVLKHRQMSWIRVDRYFKGSADDADPEVVFQPVMCQQCENAPCEQVCPATATVHDTEGLNTMVYNRCIGTRYCSNNCSYKVRRFNYFDFHSKDPRKDTAEAWAGIPDTQQNQTIDPLRRMAFNPEVTVRMRGVMEKCTYCVQRIHAATAARRMAAANGQGGQTVADGEILTACQQACPTQAITFGNLNDREAGVARLHANPRSYDLLGELNTRPRTKYLAKLRNPAEA